MSFWRAIWLLVTLPFRIIGFLTRNLPLLILVPLRIALSFIFIGGFAFAILVAVYAHKSYRHDISAVLRMPERTIALDRTGAEIGTLHGENRRRIDNLREEVPSYFIDALILQEDRSFWTHGGVDPRGVARAIFQIYKHGRATQGASTLTMQLAKNTYNHRERNMDHKLLEVALAKRIEASYDKETILKAYINRIFWGHTFLGLKQAARGYFCKEPRELTLGECALLAGIVCNPNEFSPHRNPAGAKIQRDKVLKLMYEHKAGGGISRNEYEAALAEPINTQWPQLKGQDNYVMDMIRSEVDFILRSLDSQQQNEREELVYAGGLVVKTSLDMRLQDAVMHAMDKQLRENVEAQAGYAYPTRAQYQAQLMRANLDELARMSPQYLQGACVVIHHATGALLAVVGGRDSKESPLNRAVQSRRAVGSLFKPFVYASYFEHAGSPHTMISDGSLQAGEIKGAGNWRPRNADGRFTGMHHASYGPIKSRNTMSIRVGNAAGLNYVVEKARRAGFRESSAGKIGPTLFLGTWEASPLEVASAYTCFANGGARPTPFLIDSISDASGREIWRRDSSKQRIFSARATKLTTEILEQITKAGGSAAATAKLGFTAPSAGKTGTTNNYTNAWFSGFSSELTATVWVGFDRPKKIMDKGYGSKLALPIWVEVMKAAQQLGYPMGAIRYSPDNDVSGSVRLCRVSGKLAHSGCEYAGCAYDDKMIDPEQKGEFCTQHAEMAIDDEMSEGELGGEALDIMYAEDPDAP